MSHILVADDEPEIRRYFASWLSKAGHEVTLASDGREALERIAEKRPDAVVLDVMMPRMDGFDVLAALRRDAAMRELPVMLLTAKSADADVYRDVWGPYVDQLDKPVRPKEMLARLDWCFRTKRAAPVVLVVDDEDRTRELIGKALRAEGLRVDAASSGDAALQRITRYRPDLIILDQGMPHLDGMEVQRQLKADPRSAAIPIIMLLLTVADADLTREWQRATSYWLPKPISPVQVAQGAVQLLTGVTPSALMVMDAFDYGPG